MPKLAETLTRNVEQQLKSKSSHTEVKLHFASAEDLSVACSDFLASQVGSSDEMIRAQTASNTNLPTVYERVPFAFTNKESEIIEINLGILRIGYTMLLVSADMAAEDSLHLIEREIFSAFLLKNPGAKISSALFDQVKPLSMRKLAE